MQYQREKLLKDKGFGNHPDADPESLITEKGVAEFLGVGTRTIQKWRCSGAGPKFVKISSRCIRYRRADLIAFVNEHRRSNTIER